MAAAQLESMTRDAFESLARSREPYSLSLYIPTEVAGAATRENPIRFKTKLQHAERQLQALDLEATRISKMLEPAAQLVEDHDLWQHQSASLVVLLSSNQPMRTFALPTRVKPRAVVSDRFDLSPALPVFLHDRPFCILALSGHHVALYEATRFGMTRVELPDMFTSMEQLQGIDDPERVTTWHSGTARTGPSGERPAVFHGHGHPGDKDDTNRQRQDFIEHISQHLSPMLRRRNLPLLLAGHEPMLSMFRHTVHYDHILDEELHQNVEVLDEDELHSLAVARIASHFHDRSQRVIDEFQHLVGTDPTWTSIEVDDVVFGGIDGQVKRLIVDDDAECWGTLEEHTRTLEIHEDQKAGDIDLNGVASVEAWLHGADVHLVDREFLPTASPVAAVLRYAKPEPVSG